MNAADTAFIQAAEAEVLGEVPTVMTRKRVVTSPTPEGYDPDFHETDGTHVTYDELALEGVFFQEPGEKQWRTEFGGSHEDESIVHLAAGADVVSGDVLVIGAAEYKVMGMSVSTLGGFKSFRVKS